MNSYTVRIDPEDENSEMTWHPLQNSVGFGQTNQIQIPRISALQSESSVVVKLSATERAETADIITRNSETLMTDESFLDEAAAIDLREYEHDYELKEAIAEAEWDSLVKKNNAEFLAKYGIDLDEPEIEEVDKVALEEDSEENEDKRFDGETKELVVRPKVIPFGGTLRVNHKTIKQSRPHRFQTHFRPIVIN